VNFFVWRPGHSPPFVVTLALGARVGRHPDTPAGLAQQVGTHRTPTRRQMVTGREIAGWVREGVEQGLRDRFATTNPVTRGVVTGVYEGVTGRKLKLPKRRRPWSMRAPNGTPWSFRVNGRPRRLLAMRQVKRRPVQRQRRVRRRVA
jgi:hypothetical protein